MNQSTFINNAPFKLLVQATMLFWLIAKLMSFTLWTNERTFPLMPVLDFLYVLPNQIHLFLYGLSAICLAILILKPFTKKLLLVLFCCEILSCLLDENRWQPWEYQYLCMLWCFIVFYTHPKITIQCVIIILAFTYIYSGLQKLNFGFIKNMWVGVILEDFFKLSSVTISKYHLTKLGYALPICETLFGVGILFKKTSYLASWLLLFLHIILLIVIGPLGINYNTIVWPWNMAMIIFLYILFIKNITIFEYIFLLKSKWALIIVVLWAIMPSLNFIGLWDNYLSANLYSGKTPSMAIYSNDIPENTAIYEFVENKEDTAFKEKISIQNWALKELNVPQYPEMRVYKNIRTQLIKTYPNIEFDFEITHSAYNDSLTKVLNK